MINEIYKRIGQRISDSIKEKWVNAVLQIEYIGAVKCFLQYKKPDGEAVPYAAEYGFKTIKSSKNKPEAGSLIVEYLARYAPENELAKKIFAKINKDFENLSTEEREVFTANFPHIFRN